MKAVLSALFVVAFAVRRCSGSDNNGGGNVNCRHRRADHHQRDPPRPARPRGGTAVTVRGQLATGATVTIGGIALTGATVTPTSYTARRAAARRPAPCR